MAASAGRLTTRGKPYRRLCACVWPADTRTWVFALGQFRRGAVSQRLPPPDTGIRMGGMENGGFPAVTSAGITTAERNEM
jgi:hypothetical protein